MKTKCSAVNVIAAAGLAVVLCASYAKATCYLPQYILTYAASDYLGASFPANCGASTELVDLYVDSLDVYQWDAYAVAAGGYATTATTWGGNNWDKPGMPTGDNLQGFKVNYFCSNLGYTITGQTCPTDGIADGLVQYSISGKKVLFQATTCN